MRRAALCLLIFALVIAATPLLWVDGPTKTIYYQQQTTIGVVYLETTIAFTDSGQSIIAVSGTPPPGIIWAEYGMCNGSRLCTAYHGTPNNSAAGTYTQTLRVVNGAQTEDLVVEFRPVFGIGGTAAAGVVDATYEADFTLDGGVAPSVWDAPTGSIPPGLAFDTNTGKLTGTPTTAGTYTFTLAAHDSTPSNITKDYTVTIYGALAVTTTNLPATTVSVPYAQTLASTGGATPKTWAIGSGALPAGISLTPSTGQLAGMATTPGTYTFDAQVGCCTTASATGSLSIVVNPAPLLTTSSLPGGTVGTVYPSQSLTATGGTGALTWTMQSGTLPAGLTLSGTGVISGTPTASGTSPFVVLITDAVGATTTGSLYITVIDPPQITPPTLSTLTVGQNAAVTLAATRGTAPYTWDLAAGALPPGVTLGATTGLLSGQPAQEGTFSFTLRATDAAEQQATYAASWTVNAAPAITTGSIPMTTISRPLSATAMTATGGTGTLTWSATGLPAGLTLTAQGQLSGTPVLEGTSSVVFTVVDSNDVSASQTLTITVNPLPQISTSSLPFGVMGTAYSQMLASTGGTGAMTYSVTGGALPTGLALAADGTISGTPADKGSYVFTVTVQDSLAANTSSSLSILVVDTPVILTSALPEWTATQFVHLQLAAEKGTAPYRWAVTGGALPSGLQLDPNTGSATGTATVGGTGAMTVQVTDSQNLTVSRTLLWKVNAAPTILVPTAPRFVVGQPAEWALSYQGGTAALSGYAEGLPPGLALNTHSGLITGTPTTAGTYSPSFTLIDGNSIRGNAAATVGVYPGLTIETPALNPVTAGQPVARPIALSGGQAPFAWTIAGGALPPGLIARMSDGTVEGTAGVAGVSQFTLKVRDANGVEAAQSYSLTVNEPLAVKPMDLPALQAGQTVTRAIGATGGTAPLHFALASGTLPAGVALTADGSLSGTVTTPGTFGFGVKVTDVNGATASRLFSLDVTAADKLRAAPAALSFTAYQGGAAPAPQQVALTSTPSNQTVQIASNAAWLQVSMAQAITPAVLTVSVVPGALTPGDYTGAVQVTGAETRTVTVAFHYAAAPPMELTTSPSTVTVSAGTGEATIGRLLVLRSTSAAEPWSVTTGDSWLAVEPESGSFDSTMETALTVQVQRANLRAGTYQGSLTFHQGAATAEVPVTLTLEADSDFELSQSGLHLVASPDSMTLAEPLVVLNRRGTTLDWTASASAPWLTMDPASGTAQPSSTMQVIADASSLAAGSYTGTITVTPAGGGGARSAEVRLDVTNDGLMPQVTPSGLAFSGSVAATQPLTLRNPTAAALGFTASIAPVEAGSWLALSAVSGQVAAAGSKGLTVSVTPGAAGAGLHRAQIAVEFSDGTIQVANVLLNVPSDNCQANGLQANWVRFGDHFSVSAGLPAPIELLVTDSCGQPVSEGLGLVSFSSPAEAALPLVPGPDGHWTATWTPAQPAGSVTMHVQVRPASGQAATLAAIGRVTAQQE